MYGKAAKKSVVLSGTTVQEINTTFPTNAKLAKKSIDKLNRVVEDESVA